MNKEKWLKCYEDSLNRANNAASKFVISPENWGETKTIFQKFIKEMDESVEVYNMENKNGK